MISFRFRHQLSDTLQHNAPHNQAHFHFVSGFVGFGPRDGHLSTILAFKLDIVMGQVCSISRGRALRISLVIATVVFNITHAAFSAHASWFNLSSKEVPSSTDAVINLVSIALIALALLSLVADLRVLRRPSQHLAEVARQTLYVSLEEIRTDTALEEVWTDTALEEVVTDTALEEVRTDTALEEVRTDTALELSAAPVEAYPSPIWTGWRTVRSISAGSGLSLSALMEGLKI